MAFLASCLVSSAQISSSVGIQLSKEEEALAILINNHRLDIGLDSIPLSAALTSVARTHLTDLQQNAPHSRRNCNLHSWSNNGKWKGCCYNGRQSSFNCMWDKPAELTYYKGKGYEIAYFQTNEVSADDALQAWLASKGHRIVIENQGIWKSVEWKAMGLAVQGNFALVWFGEIADGNAVVSPAD